MVESLRRRVYEVNSLHRKRNLQFLAALTSESRHSYLADLLWERKAAPSAAGSCEPGQALTGAALSIRFRVWKGWLSVSSVFNRLAALRAASLFS